MAKNDQKRALVCGASQGIGEAISAALANDGFAVTCLARNQEKLERVVQKLAGEGHSFLAVDLGDLEGLKVAVMAELRQGDYSVLICNAGGPKPSTVAEAHPDDFSRAFGEHVLANQTLVQCLLPGMRSQKFGRIINIISTSVKAPIPNLLVSNTIRAAVANWAKTLASELGPEGITVNNVLPGFTATERLNSLLAATAKRTGKTEDEVKKIWLESIPARRFAKPNEIADVVAFLASNKAGYINGINIPVDGGRTPSL